MDIKPTIATGLLMLLAAAATPVLADDCADTATATANVDRLDRDIAQMREQNKTDETSIQSRINATSQALIDSGEWTPADREKFFKKLVKSGDFKKLAKKKQSALDQYGTAAAEMTTSRSVGDYLKACVSANQMRTEITNAARLNDQQYELILERLQDVSR